ncbi:collagen alpha-1(VIII) chain-like [Centropristis striata]|uniref:collagen alpha-1(VIII) chain-like n=1 Tax=Centropristis striata TaxID=184440 RepID=UPI0027E068AB|nr:collagen alpha-1(VIII) chain-like [Centropristis striata]
MKVTESFLLLLLLAACPMLKSTSASESPPPNIYDALRELKEEIALLKGTQVAFSVSLLPSGSETQGPFPVLTTLIFKHVLTNIGDGYNKHTGVFTAPVKGAYHFEWHVGAHGYTAGGLLVKNSTPIFLAYEKQTAHFGTASNSATVLLEVGDTVVVRLWPHTKVYDNWNHHTTFSGHLLFLM